MNHHTPILTLYNLPFICPQCCGVQACETNVVKQASCHTQEEEEEQLAKAFYRQRLLLYDIGSATMPCCLWLFIERGSDTQSIDTGKCRLPDSQLLGFLMMNKPCDLFRIMVDHVNYVQMNCYKHISIMCCELARSHAKTLFKLQFTVTLLTR